MRRPLIVAVLMSFMLASCAAANDPASTIEKYAEEYNADDMDALMELFSEESVIIGHPESTRAEGLTFIREVQVSDRGYAALEDPYTFSNIEVTGTAVTWDQVWHSNEGETFCAVGQSAVVEDGVILLWTWPDNFGDC